LLLLAHQLLKQTAATVDSLDGLVSEVWLVDQKMLLLIGLHHLLLLTRSIQPSSTTSYYTAVGIQGHGGLVLLQGLLDQY